MTLAPVAPYELDEVTTIPSDLTEGLNSQQQTALEQTVFKINLGFGCVIRDTAELLYQLKETIPHGHWTLFLKSNLIPLSQRSAGELVKARDWIMNTCVSDEMLARLSTRVLQKISVARPAIQQKIEQKLANGERVTESYVNQLVQTNNRVEDDEPEEELRQYERMYVENLERENIELQSEVNTLKSRVKQLQLMLKETAVEV